MEQLYLLDNDRLFEITLDSLCRVNDIIVHSNPELCEGEVDGLVEQIENCSGGETPSVSTYSNKMCE